jgi:transcriptional regulator with XRE-family HTH domain
VKKGKLTPLGKFLRKKRKVCQKTLLKMANDLEISSAYLSAVEYGKKNISSAVLDKVIILLSLSDDDIVHIKLLVSLSSNVLEVDISKLNAEMKLLFIDLTKVSSNLSIEKVKEIRFIINGAC